MFFPNLPSSRHGTPALLSLVLALIAAACGPATRPDREQVKQAYAGHTVLLWAVDKTGKSAGFAQGVVRPSGQLKLEPATGYVVTYSAGPLEESEYHQGQSQWAQDTLPLKIQVGSGSSEGSYDLTNPRVNVEYDSRDGRLQSVTFLAPVGSLQSKSVAQRLTAGIKGGLSDLDDLLLAGVRDDTLPTGRVLEVYDVLHDSARREQWAALMDDKSAGPAPSLSAAAVLARLGDPAATDRFCDACLSATGNAQVELIEALSGMPASDKAMHTLVALLVPAKPYLIQSPPGVAAADMDRHYNLQRALVEKYSKQKIEAYLQSQIDAPATDAATRKRLGELLARVRGEGN